jgi:SP family general alpha glucoside:H+ symporter-like MFS transporter
MVHTIQEEQNAEAGTSYLDCLRGSNLRRTEIACVAYGIQALVGSPLQQYTVYFFESAGLAPSKAFPLNLGNSAISVVGTVLAWPLLSYFGRRTIFLNGFGHHVHHLLCNRLCVPGDNHRGHLGPVLLAYHILVRLLTIGSSDTLCHRG